MDGVLLTGGKASRLGPITQVTNKHLLPVYNKPIIFYGIELLRDLGCERIIIILGGNSVGDIVNLIRDGSQFGVEVVYKFQHEPRGISDAVRLAEDVILGDDFLVLLGDNIFSNVESLKKSVNIWREINISTRTNPRQPWLNQTGFKIFLSHSDHPHDYGQPVFYETANAVHYLVEKDTRVNHNLIVTGLYGLDRTAFEIIKNQKPSARGEYEITDTLSAKGLLHSVYEGFWSDCGTPEGLAEATHYFMDKEKGII